MREPERSEGQWRGKTFCLLLRRLSKVSRRKGGTRKKPWRTQWISPQIQKIKRSQPAAAPTEAGLAGKLVAYATCATVQHAGRK